MMTKENSKHIKPVSNLIWISCSNYTADILDEIKAKTANINGRMVKRV